MRVTTIDQYAPEPGRFVQWTVDSAASVPAKSSVPPSLNQSFHLNSADAGSTWLAASFDVDGPIDVKALRRTYCMLITRHGTLHSAFVRHEGRIERELHDPAALRLREQPAVATSSASELRALLWDSLNSSCYPFGFPAYLLGAVDRPGRSTIICGFDHAHVDAYSVSLVIDDLYQLYRGCRNDPDGFIPHSLPMAGNFVDYCAAESRAEAVSPTDPRMRAWLTFFDEHYNMPPSFPLDLGLPRGQTAPQAVDLRDLLGSTHTGRFEDYCRANGASVFAGVLAAMAQAIRNLGGGPQMSLLFPLHTRNSDSLRNAVGWFTTNAPLKIVTSCDFTETVRISGPALRKSIVLGEIPITQVLEAMGSLEQDRRDIFMVSYVDYRRLPGYAAHEEIDAQHISNVGTADDAQFWISRTDQGLALRTRFPGSAGARGVISGFLDEVTRLLHAAAPQD